jgi:hypothetical protein
MEAIRKQASKLREQVARQQQVSAPHPGSPSQDLRHLFFRAPAAGSHRPASREIRLPSLVGC